MRVATTISRSTVPLAIPLAHGPDGVLQRCQGRTCPPGTCDHEEGPVLRRRALGAAEPTPVPRIVHEVLRSPGMPLDTATRDQMETSFGHDFSRVRVHTGAKAAGSADSVHALAYTVGRDIVFSSGQYAPGTARGTRILAHELAHVVQQAAATCSAMSAMRVGKADDSSEREADAAVSTLLEKDGQPRARNDRMPLISSRLGSPVLRRTADCSLDHIDKECGGAAASCLRVKDECAKRYPKPGDIDAAIEKGKSKAKEMSADLPSAAANMLHFLDNTGTERVMPVDVFAKHAATKGALLKHRQKFLDGAKRRLEAGTLVPGSPSEQMVWTDTASAFSILSKDDLGLAVGGYTLCSKVRVRATKTAENRFEIAFVEWTVQAFDCYNWDPGKGIGIPGADDTDMCCIENAGKAKHFKIRTDEWKNADPDSLRAETITAKVPAAPAKPSPQAPAPGPLPMPPPPPPPK